MHSVKKISFNGVDFINRMGINAVCPNQMVADGVYEYLMVNSKIINGTKRFFFLDAIVNVAFQRMKYSRYKIINSGRYYFFLDLWDAFWFLFFGITKVIDFKYCGFFSIAHPIGNSRKNQYRLKSSGYAHIEGVSVSNKFCSYILDDSLFVDERNQEILLNSALRFCGDSETENYFFFLESEVISAIEKHYADSIQDISLLDAELFYQDGVNLTKNDKEDENKVSAEFDIESMKNSEGYSIDESELRSVNPDRFIATTELIFEFIAELKINSFLIEEEIYKYFEKTYKNNPWITSVKSFSESNEGTHRSLSKHDAYMFITALILLFIDLKDSERFNQTGFFDKLEDSYKGNMEYVGWKKGVIQKFFAPKKRLLQSISESEN